MQNDRQKQWHRAVENCMKSDSRYLQQVSHYKHVAHLCAGSQFELVDASCHGITKKFADLKEKRAILTASVSCDANLAVMGDILIVQRA